MALVYRTGQTPEELTVLADVFAEALEKEDPGTIKRAFALHIKNCKYFPTPAHIGELLPECRIFRERTPQPEVESNRTPGLARQLYREFKQRKQGVSQIKEEAANVLKSMIDKANKS